MKIVSLGKIRKTIQKVVCWIFTHHVKHYKTSIKLVLDTLTFDLYHSLG